MTGVGQTVMLKWVHSSVARAADCRSAGPWFKSGCALHYFLFVRNVIAWRARMRGRGEVGRSALLAKCLFGARFPQRREKRPAMRTYTTASLA